MVRRKIFKTLMAMAATPMALLAKRSAQPNRPRFAYINPTTTVRVYTLDEILDKHPVHCLFISRGWNMQQELVSVFDDHRRCWVVYRRFGPSDWRPWQSGFLVKTQ